MFYIISPPCDTTHTTSLGRYSPKDEMHVRRFVESNKKAIWTSSDFHITERRRQELEVTDNEESFLVIVNKEGIHKPIGRLPQVVQESETAEKVNESELKKEIGSLVKTVEGLEKRIEELQQLIVCVLMKNNK